MDTSWKSLARFQKTIRKPSKPLKLEWEILGSTQYLLEKRDRIWHPKDCSNTSRSCSSWTGYGPLNLEAAENGAEGLYEGTKDGEAYSGKQLVIRVLCLLNHNNIRQHHDARCILPILFKKHWHIQIIILQAHNELIIWCRNSKCSLPYLSLQLSQPTQPASGPARKSDLGAMAQGGDWSCGKAAALTTGRGGFGIGCFSILH